jgi:thermitase
MFRRTRPLMLIGLALLLIIGVARMMPDREVRTLDRNTIDMRKVNDEPSQDQTSRLMDLNNDPSNNRLVSKLNHHSEIQIINHNENDQSHYYEHEATVKFKTEISDERLAQINKEIDASRSEKLANLYMFRSKSKTTHQMLLYFRGLEEVEYAEPNFILLQNEAVAPNDTYYQEQYQWNLPVIETEKGWDISKGDKNVVIAVVDTGVDLDHPDLKHKLVEGYNAIDEKATPDDDNGHGTHVAGIIASETNNHEGVAGITWYNQIMPVKTLAKDGYGYTFDIAKGIVWATDHGADVINLSLGNYQPATVLKEAIQYAYDKGVVLIAASGNDNTNQPSYPAAFDQVLSVSAIGYSGERASFSNYGNYIDVAAPGVDIPSTYFENQYAALSGTSMASPHVTGLAGLILSTNPTLSNKEVMDIIRSSSYDIGEVGKDEYFGEGLIDVNRALAAAKRK